MKQIIYILTSLFLTAGCGPDTPRPAETVKLSVDNTTLEFTAEGGEQTFTVTASEQVYLVPADTWIKASRAAADDSFRSVVTVTAGKNPTTEPRQTRLSVVAGDEKLYVDITQAAGTGEDNGDNTGGEPVVPERSDNLAWQVADLLGLGWNLGNHFDAHSNGVSGETKWGNPPATQETFDRVKAAGFTTVRIPVTWLGQFGEAPEYKINDGWMNRVAEVVGYAENAGLKAIINMHHDGADSGWWLNIISAAQNPAVHARIMEQITAMWTQIAEKFKNKGEFLIFESFNEIHDGKWGWGTNLTDGGAQYRCMNEWNQAFVDAVRATGGNNATRLLGVPAYCTNVDIAIESFVMPEDSAKDRLMLAVHCYDPSEYTLTAKYSEWGHTASSAKKAAGDNEADLKKVFEKLYVNYVSKGIPVYMGEFGCVNRATEREQAFQQYYLKYYAKVARTYGVPCLIWDNGAKGVGNECHAFIDHGTGAFCSPEAEAAIRAMIGSYGNALTIEDTYNTAPK